jgi:hypothetical protein
MVRYIDYAREDMADCSMLGLFFHKRIEFHDECEVRALLSLRTAAEFGVPIPDDGLFVEADRNELIHQARLWPAATEEDVSAVRDMVLAAGVDCPVSPSTLASTPTY